MKKILDYVLSAIYLTHFGLTLLVFHVLQVIAFHVFGKKVHKAVVDYLNFFLTYGLYLTGSRITLQNLTQLPDNRPIIFVANHQSTFDIPAIIWFLRKYHPRFVSKIELSKGVPSISYNLRKSGAALINRKDGKQAVTEIARLGKLIHDEKTSAIIFPEGTRTASGIMKPFVPGGVATLLKRAPDALIVPIAINGTGSFNPKGIFPLKSFSHLSWTVLPGIEPAGKKAEDILAEAKEAIQNSISKS
ncbi:MULTISPECIES: 1-acyl-sn-glycerol-3-phosphate acyltransferase [unclassified Dyadobacter]|uniref:lysophospholipid acyltransferase family protein n=1 Tax=unclassified Dyadobacter TaxID=2625061 RepID=UPI001F3378F0|nr:MULTISPECIES: lysophospholipid acyltransferase family protein [unclassified Dyadobacter]MCE7070209.1 1-acyl-sn-glycerol-3-phosphate acyltransferase [Dyadobacter sp. CY327]MCF2520477.1 1-acyl-sn-glycerol-3-phosphate acyltransferase [Dyadobacter sp. CY351]